jgi:hypothetical protein
MSQRSGDEADHDWDEIIVQLARDSADCGALLGELITGEARPKPVGTPGVLCTGRGSAHRGRGSFVWEYWTRQRSR